MIGGGRGGAAGHGLILTWLTTSFYRKDRIGRTPPLFRYMRIAGDRCKRATVASGGRLVDTCRDRAVPLTSNNLQRWTE
jgi:hypothetical protein